MSRSALPGSAAVAVLILLLGILALSASVQGQDLGTITVSPEQLARFDTFMAALGPLGLADSEFSQAMQAVMDDAVSGDILSYYVESVPRVLPAFLELDPEVQVSIREALDALGAPLPDPSPQFTICHAHCSFGSLTRIVPEGQDCTCGCDIFGYPWCTSWSTPVKMRTWGMIKRLCQ